MGARPGQVLRMIAGRGMSLAAGGLAIGVFASWAVSGLIRTILFGVGERDVRTLATVSLALAAVALAACVIPARRASRIDPASALRND